MTHLFHGFNDTKKVINCQGGIILKNLDLKKIVIVAVLIALFFVLSIFGTINFGSVKITVQNLPIYIAAIEFGPIYGLLVGGIGILLNQIVVYGFMPTTIIWIIPHLVFGYVCGIVYKNEKFLVWSSRL